ARRHPRGDGSSLGGGGGALRRGSAGQGLRTHDQTGAPMNYLHQFAFQIYPYIAIAVFFIGSWARFDYAMYTWRTGSSQLLSSRGMRLGSNLFHVGILAILGGHLVGLLTPHSVY